MASINDVTGDRLVVGGFSPEGEANFERIFGKKKKSRIDVIGQQGNDGLAYTTNAELDTLDRDHPNRNVTLKEIGAEYRSDNETSWHPLPADSMHAHYTFNELRSNMTDRLKWRATK